MCGECLQLMKDIAAEWDDLASSGDFDRVIVTHGGVLETGRRERFARVL